MAPYPSRSIYKQQALVLRELKAHSLSSLNHVDTTRFTDLAGYTVEVENVRRQPLHERPAPSLEAAESLHKLATLQMRPEKDCLPCRVADGLYIGGAGAAHNLKALRKRGITHIVNASPSVPCHFKDNPEGCFQYLGLQLFDDVKADLMSHVGAANAFIAEGRTQGAVLVHCYAGQSRSAALVISYLISQGLSFMDAWAATRRARPCIQPNSGFLRQLALYNKSLSRPLGSEAACLAEGAAETARTSTPPAVHQEPALLLLTQ